MAVQVASQVARMARRAASRAARMAGGSLEAQEVRPRGRRGEPAAASRAETCGLSPLQIEDPSTPMARGRMWPSARRSPRCTELPVSRETDDGCARGRRPDPMAATRVCNVRFESDVITTTVTGSGAAVEDWINEVLAIDRRLRQHKLVVGLDVEWRPSFSQEYSKTALLQLCVGRRCLIFQLLHRDYYPDALCDFLYSSGYTFVGVGVQADAHRLCNDFGQVDQTVDLAYLAAEKMERPDLRNAGLKGIAAAVMDAHIEKPRRVRIGRWDAYELSDEQVKYACIDAFVSFEVGRRLLNGDY